MANGLWVAKINKKIFKWMSFLIKTTFFKKKSQFLPTTPYFDHLCIIGNSFARFDSATKKNNTFQSRHILICFFFSDFPGVFFCCRCYALMQFQLFGYHFFFLFLFCLVLYMNMKIWKNIFIRPEWNSKELQDSNTKRDFCQMDTTF